MPRGEGGELRGRASEVRRLWHRSVAVRRGGFSPPARVGLGSPVLRHTLLWSAGALLSNGFAERNPSAMNRSNATGSERLRNHLRALVDEILKEVSSGLQSGSPEAVASNRESVLSEILSRFFPRTYDVAKGKIFDAHGGVSDSIDLVVLAGNHPKFRNARGQIELLLADGVHSAIELKPVLTDLPRYDAERSQSPEIWRALKQIRSVKQLRRVASPLLLDGHSPELDDYSRRVPSYLVTAKAPPASALAEYIARYYEHHGIPPTEQVDCVTILDGGLILNVKYPEHRLAKKPPEFAPVLLAFDTENSLAELLVTLMTEVPAEPHLATPILGHYLGDALKNKRTAAFEWHPPRTADAPP
jgi:hypothetical protein